MSTIICNNRFAIPAIDIDECIGLSLLTINNNFNDLKQENCLTFDQLSILQNNLNSVYTNYAELSTINKQGRFAKAWVSFDASTTTPAICSSFNVTNVTRTVDGTYQLTFAPSVLSSGYCLVGTALSGIVQPSAYNASTATINIRTPSGVLTKSEYISITVFSL